MGKSKNFFTQIKKTKSEEKNRLFFGLMRRVFINGLGDRDSIQGRVVPKTQKNGT